MKRKYSRLFATFACLGLLAISACGGGHTPEDLDEGVSQDHRAEEENEDAEENGSFHECTEDDWSACNIFAGETCFAGLCVGGNGGGGGGECQSSFDCPNVDDICSNGVCM